MTATQFIPFGLSLLKDFSLSGARYVSKLFSKQYEGKIVTCIFGSAKTEWVTRFDAWHDFEEHMECA